MLKRQKMTCYSWKHVTNTSTVIRYIDYIYVDGFKSEGNTNDTNILCNTVLLCCNPPIPLAK